MKEKVILFSKDHLWVQQEDALVKIGLSDFAGKKLGCIVFLNLPETGEQLQIGEKLGDVESVKTVCDLISPVAGEVASVNEELLEAPEMVNINPYEFWLVKVAGAQLSDGLMTEEEYQKYKENCDV